VIIIFIIVTNLMILQEQALLGRLESKISQQPGSFCSLQLFGGELVLRFTRYKGLQQMYCNPFPKKQFY
jgi:hypothetical protein